ncbi:beta-N-acetylhexosaminidase [Roseomonas marmotae]|uniref:beta-N-acetylhexosaminidase n=1 Tax=Roseomonas marmotae TaxID=2768161 RepID=A0ABS3KCU4_9PROT|nr:beta-N-acetylhexosaminidase [Roseomonas marmotae]MBO1075267.1 beta-N-acetylhexosaminidase [Roseomonas marmotae]QTI78250.1 beta-N-acetylhexosaminidase [Roseomonas marmotae]
MDRARAVIIGFSGPALLAEEVALLRRFRPVGAILFARNVESPAQLAGLTAAIREELGESAPILVDQEGGRVARLRPPHWPGFPPPAAFEGRNPAAAEANATLLAMECVAAGLDVVCSPVLDLRLPGSHDVIGDRGFSADPREVIRVAEAWVRGLQSGGAIPVMKHMPGHGRAMVDSHLELPRVTAERLMLAADFAPFAALARCGAWAMTAHLLYTDLDPEHPATLSPRVIQEVMRGEIGFDGVLVSDDLDMKALSGSPGELVAAALAAGCDLALQCSGRLEDSAAALAAAGPLTEKAEARMAAARAARDAACNGVFPDPIALAGRRDALLRDVA